MKIDLFFRFVLSVYNEIFSAKSQDTHTLTRAHTASNRLKNIIRIVEHGNCVNHFLKLVYSSNIAPREFISKIFLRFRNSGFCVERAKFEKIIKSICSREVVPGRAGSGRGGVGWGGEERGMK